MPDWAQGLLARAHTDGESAQAAVDAARTFGTDLPQPGVDTATRWAVLAGVGAANLTTARVLEAHTDALSILAEAGEPSPDGSWGVFAAEMPDVRLDAERDGADFRLTGIKPWCSLGGLLDAALVTAHTPDGRQLFRVDLRQDDVTPEPAERWLARGLRTVTSAPVRFDGARASAVGPPGWYLRRAGFAWGGMGVAACWYGGARGLEGALLARAARTGADLDAMHLGAVDAALHAADATLLVAARAVDDGAASQDAGAALALRARAVVADAVERTLRHAAHALGPAPLAFDAEHAARVADLELYVRQHHAERDLVALGRARTDGAQ